MPPHQQGHQGERRSTRLSCSDCGLQTFDELLLLKRGGSVIYNGPLGRQSAAMISYFSAIDGVTPIEDGYSASLRCRSCSLLETEYIY